MGSARGRCRRSRLRGLPREGRRCVSGRHPNSAGERIVKATQLGGGGNVKSISRIAVTLGLVALAAAVIAGAGTAGKRAGILACGLMPDTKTSVRWEQFDRPYLEKAFKAAGVSARVVNAQGDPQKQKTQA